MLAFSTSNTNMVLEASAVSHATPIDTSHGAPNDGNCRLTIPVVKGRCTCDALLHTFIISIVESVENDFNTIKHIDNESANIIEGCIVVLTPLIAVISKNSASDWL